MKTVIINVTEKDIVEGLRASSTSCPIARAVKRRTVLDLIISRKYVKLFNQYGDEFRKIELPGKAQQFICDYDSSYLVKPFRFKIDL